MPQLPQTTWGKIRKTRHSIPASTAIPQTGQAFNSGKKKAFASHTNQVSEQHFGCGFIDFSTFNVYQTHHLILDNAKRLVFTTLDPFKPTAYIKI